MPGIAPLDCPECRMRWDRLPIPAPVQGLQATYQRCPSRKCTRRHWIIVYRVEFVPMRLRVVSVVHLLGRDPQSIRQTLRAVPGMDESVIEWTVAAMHAPAEVAA